MSQDGQQKRFCWNLLSTELDTFSRPVLVFSGLSIVPFFQHIADSRTALARAAGLRPATETGKKESESPFQTHSCASQASIRSK